MSRSRGSAAFSFGTAARIASTVAMMFAPGWRKTMTSTLGLPSASPRFRRFSNRILHPRDVLQPHRVAVAVGHDQRPVVRRMVGLVVGVDLPAMVADIDVALGAVGIGARQRRTDILQTDAGRRQFQRIEFHADGGLCGAADDDLPDAGDLRQLLFHHAACRVVHLAARQRRGGQREDQNRRVCRVDLAVGRLRQQVRGQIRLSRVDRGLHVLRRAVDVAVESELQRDARLPGLALRRHFGHVGDLAEMPLQRRGQAGRDDVRAGTRQLRPSPRWSENRPAAAAPPAARCSPGCRRARSRWSTRSWPTGRAMKGAEMFTRPAPARPAASAACGRKRHAIRSIAR